MTGRPPQLLPAFDTLPLDDDLLRDLRSDHAGETGAVWIYKGILAVTGDESVREFARAHLATERQHLDFFERWLPRHARSRLTPLWRAAGWALGALPAFFGPAAVFRTIEAVETFVEDHYQQQIAKLAQRPEWAPLRTRLQHFCAEEVHHRDEAGASLASPPGRAGRLWMRIVETGSAAGVRAARSF
jgi:ubiquinone biosynthesis monooxygenase Coq7